MDATMQGDGSIVSDNAIYSWIHCLIIYIKIYILDTGVRSSHNTFRDLQKDGITRVEHGHNFESDTIPVKLPDLSRNTPLRLINFY